jgi:hypothetical protein
MLAIAYIGAYPAFQTHGMSSLSHKSRLCHDEYALTKD